MIISSTLITSCFKSNDDSNNLDKIIHDFSYSGCLSGLRVSNTQESLHFKILANQQLLVEHCNIYFNCKPGEIIITGEIVDQNHINIYENEETEDANCICPRNLKFKIYGVSSGDNTIKLYLMNLEKLTVNLRFSNTLDTLIYPAN
jgi:hypothetical protein